MQITIETSNMYNVEANNNNDSYTRTIQIMIL